MSDELYIKPKFKDPVKDPQLAKIEGNPFYGYYGYPRDNGQTKHFGFDYDAKEGTEVLSVERGRIVKIRIGKYVKVSGGKDSRPYSECKQLKDYSNAVDKTSFFFDAKQCSNCCEHHGCYGVQVWMSFSNGALKGKYAFYAHLSKLNGTALKNMSYSKNDAITFKIKNAEEIESGVKIGESGRTGNASSKDPNVALNIYDGYRWPPHLHFECRIGNGEVVDHRIPNNIVNTRFTIMKTKENILFGRNVWDPLKEVTQDQWKDFFKQKQREEGYNLSSPVRYIIFGDDSYNRSSLPYIIQ